MSKICFFSTPAFGHIIPEYPVIKKIIEEGNTVDWYCSKKYEEVVKKSGANFIEYSIDFDNKYNVAEMTTDLHKLLGDLLTLNRECYKIYIDRVKDDVDIIIYDSLVSFAKNIAKKLNKKSISFSSMIGYNLPVFLFSNLFFSSLKLYLNNFKEINEAIKREKVFRKENGIIKFKMTDIFINKGDKTIIFTPKELQPFYYTFSNDFKFVGTTIKDRINFKEEHYTENYDIYVSFGSVLTNREVISQILESDFFDDKKVLINIGEMKDITSNKENITLARYTNQKELLSHCKIFINQGGLNSIYESIDAGTFQICIPQQEEERLNALIVHKHKLGFCLKKFEINELKKCIEKYETNEIYKKNIEKYRKIIKSYDGTEEAIKNIL